MSVILAVVMLAFFVLGLALLAGTAINALRGASRRWFRVLNLAWALCWTAAILAGAGRLIVWPPHP